MDVFEGILAELGALTAHEATGSASGDFDLDFPTYRFCVTVDRSSKIRKPLG